MFGQSAKGGVYFVLTHIMPTRFHNPPLLNLFKTVFCALISEACKCLFTAELALARKKETKHAI